ncbi:MAG TPA: prolyl oligopeptidase family serine peptidase, partial [Candidatus Krumholzibacterium sp.]|nr:prolyl oligopeptidase family serine peptidase [Candidatus Krumholzibacterium sp.]
MMRVSFRVSVCLPAVLLLVLSVPVFGQRVEYPPTRVEAVTDQYHGREIADPYRWLEDDYSEETLAWVEAQNRVTFRYLESLPQRQRINSRLTELQDYERYSLPYKVGGYYVFMKNDGLQNQSVIFRQKGLKGKAEVLFDPNRLSEDGTTAFTGGLMSEDGRLFMYGYSESGADWRVMKVRDTKTGADLDDEIRWIKFANAVMTKDGKRFYYSRYDEPEEGKAMVAANVDHKVYCHRLGTDQSGDELILEDPEHPDHLFFGSLSEDNDYFVIGVYRGSESNNGIYYIRTARAAHGGVVRLIDEFDASYSFVGNDGETLYFMTNLDAPRFRLIAIDLGNPGRENWREIIPEQKDVLQVVSLLGGKFVAVYMHDASNRIRIFTRDGSGAGDVPLPAIGSVAEISGGQDEPEMFFSFKSFAYPPTAYRYDISKNELEVFRKSDVKVSPEDFITEQVFFTSADGERVPVFLSYRKDALKEGKAPAYIYGYGGFGVSMTPYFDVENLLWMEMGGIFALVTARGGGEFGEDWHQAGVHAKRQNVYNDFIGAAEYLIEKGYTSRDKLAIGGASNGGLVVGVCMTQRPDLFAVA